MDYECFMRRQNMDKKIKYLAIVCSIAIFLSVLVLAIYVPSENGIQAQRGTAIITFAGSSNLVITNRGNCSIGAFTYNITYASEAFNSPAFCYTPGSCNGLNVGQNMTVYGIWTNDLGRDYSGVYMLSMNGGVLTYKGQTYNFQNDNEYGWYVSLNV
jgi:hypothetical protein